MGLKKIKLADYTLAQELWNAISHGLGALFGVAVTILMMLKINGIFSGVAVIHDTEYIIDTVVFAFYGLSIIICMTVSCVYHSLAKNSGKKVMRVIDHTMVYLLVAGSYAPFCLIALREQPFWGIPGANFSGYIIIAISYVCTIIGVVFSSIDMFKYGKLAMVMYLIAGLSIMFDPVTTFNVLTLPGFMYLVFGGVAYIFGAVLYGIGKKYSIWWHTVFHFFVLAGIVLQFLSIYLYVI